MATGDRIQSQLSSYAAGLAYERLDQQTVHAAKVRIIDTIGALVGGFAGEPCRIAREVAVQMPNPHGASVIGQYQDIARCCGVRKRNDSPLRRDERRLPLARQLRRAPERS